MMAHLKLKSILRTTRPLLTSVAIKEDTSNVFVRCIMTSNITSAKRDNIYGSEEGHAEQKNEVRKEKFWRKRNPKMKGFNWREQNNYDKQRALSHGTFALIPDWSTETGEIGAPTPLQERIMEQNLQLINEIYEAAMIVKKAQEFEPSESRNVDIVETDTEHKN